MARSVRAIPRPVEALPCGSRSTSRTFSPTAARAVARLIAVVVLPTPPFWLAMARMRVCASPGGGSASAMSGCGSDTAEIGDPEDAGAGTRPAGNHFNAHVPLRRRFRQFGLDIGALRKQAGAAWCEQWRGEGQKLRQRSGRGGGGWTWGGGGGGGRGARARRGAA